jgi:flagellar basal-body rod modification protein FlgD
MSNDQKVKDVTNLDLKKDDVVAQTNKEGSNESQKAPTPAVAAVKSNLMNNVGLSREMMEKLAKETAR